MNNSFLEKMKIYYNEADKIVDPEALWNKELFHLLANHTINYFGLEEQSYIDQLGNKRNGYRKEIYIDEFIINDIDYRVFDDLFTNCDNSFTNFDDSFINGLSISVNDLRYDIYIGAVIDIDKINSPINSGNKYVYDFVKKAKNLGYYENAIFLGDKKNISNIIGKKIKGTFILSISGTGLLNISLNIFKDFTLE